MQIIKQGTIPQYRATCPMCSTVFQFHKNESNPAGDGRITLCPVCKELITVTEKDRISTNRCESTVVKHNEVPLPLDTGWY